MTRIAVVDIGTNSIRLLVADHATGRLKARAASSLGHPNIVEVYGSGTLPDGRPYLSMELLRGHTLQHELGASAAP